MARRRPPLNHPPPRGSVYPLLDLHGHTGDEARRRAEAWLRARQAAGERTVVVITGRGNRSAGPPVLRGEIEHLLGGLAGTLVDSFDLTGGGGGFHVRLRAAARVSAASAEGEQALLERHFPPDLLRRAAEALAELGVTPTPALLRAEARRLEADDAGRS